MSENVEKPAPNAYKYCFVPFCKNTTSSTPEKEFIHVPRKQNVRKLWCIAAGCPEKRLKPTSYCCEVHFNLKEDMENYTYFKTMGGRKLLKKGVVPHVFPSALNTALPSTISSDTAATMSSDVISTTSTKVESRVENLECMDTHNSSDTTFTSSYQLDEVKDELTEIKDETWHNIDDFIVSGEQRGNYRETAPKSCRVVQTGAQFPRLAPRPVQQEEIVQVMHCEDSAQELQAGPLCLFSRNELTRKIASTVVQHLRTVEYRPSQTEWEEVIRNSLTMCELNEIGTDVV